METQPNFGEAKLCATLKGFQVEFDNEHHEQAIAWLVKQAGGYDASLKVRSKLPSQPPPALQTCADDPTDAAFTRAMRVGRLQLDEQAAKASGFSPKDPIYALGRKVVQAGVENAKAERLKYEQKPLVRDACSKFAAQVAAEHRKDTVVYLSELSMREDGVLVAREQGTDRTAPIALGEGAFDSLCTKSPMGGSGYLKNCWPALRAANVNAWMNHISEQELAALKQYDHDPDAKKKPERQQIVLRCRTNTLGSREAYAVVSRGYSALDCDTVARSLFDAAPADSRGSIIYDGREARFEIMFHSDVAFEDYGAGEIFRAGVIVKTNDVGGGAIKIASVIERNLCLNLIVLDMSEIEIGRIRHVGKALEAKFSKAFQDALGRISYFRDAWGYARSDELVKDTSIVAGEDLTRLTARELLGGILWAQMKQDLVPVRGSKKEILPQLLRAYDREPNKGAQLTRADVVNVWTRYAHEGAAQTDAWIEDDIQQAAGRMLATRKAKPLPYTTVPFAL